jgi:hypothetical protein
MTIHTPIKMRINYYNGVIITAMENGIRGLEAF